MESEASTKKSPAAAGDGTTSQASAAAERTGIFGVAPRQKITPEELIVLRRFVKAVREDALRYAAMTEDDVEEEYRRAGKLHEYDLDKEVPKRLARLAQAYPPPKFLPKLEEAMKYLEDDDEDDEAPPSATGT